MSLWSELPAMQNRFWFLLSKKLSGNATDADLIELDELQAAHPEWQYSAQHITNTWESASLKEATESDFDTHIRRMGSLGHNIDAFGQEDTLTLVYSHGFSKRKWWLLCAVAASCIGIACWFIFSNTASPPQNLAPGPSKKNEVVTKSGNRSKVVLPDGSQVWLNAESRLEYAQGFGSSNRDITLNGEAYFDVVKDASLPFIIHTNNILIKVTGTAFNVKSYPGEGVSETSIIRGRVEVTVKGRPEEKYILKPSEKLVVRDEMASNVEGTTAPGSIDKKLENQPIIQLGYVNYLENDSTVKETSWLYNRLVFDDESFSEISKKMERWYGVSMHIDDEKVAAYRFTYQVRNETIEQALHNMQYAARFHYFFKDNTITITK